MITRITHPVRNVNREAQLQRYVHYIRILEHKSISFQHDFLKDRVPIDTTVHKPDLVSTISKTYIKNFPHNPLGSCFYNYFAYSFADTYFMKNMVKAVFVLQRFKSEMQSHCNFVDVGCGIGAMSFAALHVLGSNNRISAVDKSEKKIEIFSDLTMRLNLLHVHSELGNAKQFKFNDQLVRLFSYFFCENKDIPKTLSNKHSVEFFGPTGIIIDLQVTVSHLHRRLLALGYKIETIGNQDKNDYRKIPRNRNFSFLLYKRHD